MATVSIPYSPSDLDGEGPGGFVVLNLNAPMANPYQILEGGGGGYFSSLDEARNACRRWRDEHHNSEIFIYALVGVGEAIEAHPDVFPPA